MARRLAAFLRDTQPATAEALDLDQDSTTRRAFLARLQGEIAKHGGVAALRNGIQHGPHSIDLYYPTPSPGNTAAAARFALNRFTVTRQLRYSATDTARALDLAVFVNGLPLLTFELKNAITKQTVEDAVEQYKRDRDPRELLFAFGRCMAHLAVDDQRVKFCAHLKGKASWFLPFDQGWNDGAGNPPNPDGLATDYLWRRILEPRSLANIIESYAQIVTVKNPKTGKMTSTQIFPRYHQLDVVRRLLADVEANGVGRRYLVEHFNAWYSGDKLDAFLFFVTKQRGPYAPVYWLMIFCNVLVPQIFWFRWARRSEVVLLVGSILINVGMWAERPPLVDVPGSVSREPCSHCL